MSKYNTKTVSRAVRQPDKVNRAGAPAYSQNAKANLVSMLLTSFVKDQFYRSEKQGIADLKRLIGEVDPQFAAKAAIFARNEFGMRSITHIVGAEIPARVKGEKWTKRFIDRVIYRPDDATEILALYLASHGKPIPNSLKKGLALGLSKFDEYQLAKYRGDSKGVSLVDILNLVHVKPSEKNATALEKLVDGELRSTATWEAKLTEAGKSENKAEAKQEAWTDLIKTGRIGYFAALRNLRNVAKDAPEALDALLDIVADPVRIKKELVLPFRYITALDAIEKEASFDASQKQKIRRALNKALDASFVNTPKFNGRTLVAFDHSSSMSWAGGGHSRSTVEYAAVFAAALLKSNDADLMMYESRARYVNDINPDDTFTTIVGAMKKLCQGGGTDVGSVFREAKHKYDRIVILSDSESWGHGYYGGRPDEEKANYERRTGARPFVYAMDLAGYGDLSFSEKDSRVANIGGFSEKVFDVFKLLEQDREALIKRIEAVEL